ncbi:hypothetical protein Sru01_19240 [Sphaerisporangium rufum]|uniref:Uncharacterized protein n=1 Tax=Sphaerisporangium rufum TaxID=1381558 RepID=A0A919R4K8_9ACTN|nr:hypothetical protein Sru01_19240 [Sphaerisporangium rufum]
MAEAEAGRGGRGHGAGRAGRGPGAVQEAAGDPAHEMTGRHIRRSYRLVSMQGTGAREMFGHFARVL